MAFWGIPLWLWRATYRAQPAYVRVRPYGGRVPLLATVHALFGEAFGDFIIATNRVHREARRHGR